MFKKKKKTVLEVLRQHNEIKLSNNVIFELFTKYENSKCEKASIDKIYTYIDLCKLFSSYEFSEYGRFIISEDHILYDRRNCDGVDIPACYKMDPTKEALVILSRGYESLLRIFRYIPHSSEKAVQIDRLDYLKPNFELYDVFSSYSHSLVKSFDELSVSSKIIAFSKEQIPYKNNKKTLFPIIIKY